MGASMVAPSGDYIKSIVCMIPRSETAFLSHFCFRNAGTDHLWNIFSAVPCSRDLLFHNFAEIRLKYLLILLTDGLTERHAEQVTLETQNLAWTWVKWQTFGFNAERRAYESEERGVKHDSAVSVERHVHWDQPLQRTQHTAPLSRATSLFTTATVNQSLWVRYDLVWLIVDFLHAHGASKCTAILLLVTLSDIDWFLGDHL